MQTHFTLAQLADPDIQAANDILRKCVHCGFCTATCPTYVIHGDELDSPRGRIYLMKQAFEGGEGATARLAKHLDRCLTCLSCMTTCPASVDYMHLVDHGRAFVEKTYKRPWHDAALRRVLSLVLPYPNVFRLSLLFAAMGKPFRGLMPARLKAMLDLAPTNPPSPSSVDVPQVFPAEGTRRKRVVLMMGCAQKVLRPSINEATVRLLTRHGCDVIIPKGAGCCGALVHHLGRDADSHAAAKRNIAAWEHAAAEHGDIDAIVINASGCGTTVKDYGWMLRLEDGWAERATAAATKTKDVTELMLELGVTPRRHADLPRIAYHSACSMQHGQNLKTEPVQLLRNAGFDVAEPAEKHLCCGSAGTYNIMQPDWAGKLRSRKVGNLRSLNAAAVVTGNIGCLTQIAGGLDDDRDPPVLHTVEILDWVTGGRLPEGLAAHTGS